MIIVLFGNNCPLKSEVADDMKGIFMTIDDKRVKKIFKEVNTSKVSDIAVFLDGTGLDVLISLEYFNKKDREYLNSFGLDVYWVYFDDENFDMSREDERFLIINNKTSATKCLELIEDYINQY